MALFHFTVTQTKRSKGQSAIASAAYRSGEKLYSEYYGEYSDYKYLSDADKKNTFDVERYIRVQRKKKKHPSAVIAPEEPFDLYEIELSDEDADFTVAE